MHHLETNYPLEIGRTWHSGHSGSCCVVIPKAIAQRKGLYESGSTVLIRETRDGILLKKLEVESQ